MKVAANGVQRKSFLVPSAGLQIDPVDLPPRHTQLFQRHAPQEDRRFPDLPHHSIQLGTIQRKQMPPVEDARKHRRLRESLSHRLDYRCSKPFAVDAVDAEVRFLRACTPQQIDPTAVAIIYLHARSDAHTSELQSLLRIPY